MVSFAEQKSNPEDDQIQDTTSAFLAVGTTEPAEPQEKDSLPYGEFNEQVLNCQC